jgi:hypothetical protein
MSVEQISIAEIHARFKAQGVSAREHIATKCPICGTVQSIASLMRAGCGAERVETAIGFSCEGRFSKAGPWRPNDEERAKVRGCDWTLGGLLSLHVLEVVTEEGQHQPYFQVATPDEAKALEALMVAEDTAATIRA